MVLNLLNLYSLIFALFDKITDMTMVLQQFKANLSKSQNEAFSFTTPMTFDPTSESYEESTVQCFCNDILIANQTAVISLDMISNIAQNLSLLALPKLKELANILYTENLTDTTLTNNLMTTTEQALLNISENLFNFTGLFSTETTTFTPDNFTYYYENSSLYWDQNATDFLNFSVFNNSNNISIFDLNDTFSISDLKDMFVDYLTYILSPFVYVNNSIATDILATNFSLNISYDLENSTISSLNFSNKDYEYFKSTILPFFNNTLPQEEQRFETELSSLFDEISSTIATLPEILGTEASISTTSEDEETDTSTKYFDCWTYCKEILVSKGSNNQYSSTSTAIAPVNYGEVEYSKVLNYTMNSKLRSLCWETMFGQELLKLTLLDLIMNGLSILFLDFIRGIFVRVMNRCWCWDLEKKFPQYGDFKVAENILHLGK